MVLRRITSFFQARRSDDGRSAEDIESLIRSLRTQAPDQRRGANVSLTDPGLSEAFVPALIRATTDGDAYIRASAVHALGQYPLDGLRKARSAVLAALRRDTDPAVRAAAAGALGGCAAHVTAALREALRDASPEVRCNAVTGLVLAGTDDAIKAVKRCLVADPHAEVRHGAVHDLGLLKDPCLLDVLVQAVQDESDLVRAAAIYSANESAGDAHATVMQVFIAAVADPSARVREQACHALRYSTAEAIPALLSALKDGVPAVRLEAVISLLSLDATEAVEVLGEMARSDPDEEVRRYAADGLTEMREASARQRRAEIEHRASAQARVRAARHDQAMGGADLATLCGALNDPDPEVRASAARGVCGRPAFTDAELAWVVPALCQAAEDSQAAVREQVAEALGRLSHPAARAALLRAAEDAVGEVRAQAHRALSRSASTDLAAVFLKGLGDAEWEVQRVAAEGLAQVATGEHLQDLLRCVRNPAIDRVARGTLAGALVRLGPAGLAGLAAALGDEDVDLRTELCQALQHCVQPQVVAPLLSRLDDTEAVVRAEASLALAASADPIAFDPLKRLLRKEKAASVRRRVVWALSFFPPEQSLPLLTKSLGDAEAPVRRQAVRALAEVCDLNALEWLRDRLPRRTPGDVHEALTQVIEDWDEDDALPSRSQRSIQIGTLHYE